MDLDATLSLDEVGELVGHSGDWVKRRISEFEHLRPGRSIRLTTEQAEKFVRSFIVRPGSDAGEEETDPLRDQSTGSKSRRKK